MKTLLILVALCGVALSARILDIRKSGVRDMRRKRSATAGRLCANSPSVSIFRPLYQTQPEAPPPANMCTLKPERGRCSESLRQWHYDPADGTCKVFSYSGCEGNGNRFETEDECLQSCGSTQDPCSLPKVQGPCDQYTPHWYFDRDTGNCRQFYYGGCYGNANRFATSAECRATCSLGEPEPEPEPEPEWQPEPTRRPEPPPAVPDESDICYLGPDPGPCYGNVEAWYFDPFYEKCTQFVYGGCQGNANRFASEEQCERQCGMWKSQEVCADAPEEGTCDQAIEKYYFDPNENVCRQFRYSGCGGNPNRFSTLDECTTVCLNSSEPRIPTGTDQEESPSPSSSSPSFFRTDPLRFGVNSTSSHVKAGSNVTLTCNLLNENTDEAVDVEFTWLKNEVAVSPVADKIITQGNQLLIVNADEEESGNYTCVYDYNGKEGLTDTVPIVVQRVLLHPECKDHKALANCSLVVTIKYCAHKYYAKFCCKSCTEAGQLPVHSPGERPPWELIQSHSSLRRRPRSPAGE